MKKIIASAVGLMMVGGVAATTASAVEVQFGGYWRTRAFTQNDFDQVKIPVLVNGIPTTINESNGSFSRVDNRTRLYLTAKFNDDFKFVNKFEFNTNWGAPGSAGGGVGADGTGIFRIKNSYADFNLGNVNTKVGIQAAVLARGFIFDDDFSGIVVSPKFGNVGVSAGVISVYTEDGGNQLWDQWMPYVEANINITDAISIKPYFLYYAAYSPDLPAGALRELGLRSGGFDSYYIGLDAEWKLDTVGIWGTAIYNGGQVDDINVKIGDVILPPQDADISGYLLAAGADAGLVHGQIFYASGDDSAKDGDLDGFQSAPGQSYYWSEIMGLGIFDNTASANAPGNLVTNILAANVGVTFKPMDKMTLVGDLWYATLAEDNIYGDDGLGLELDGKLTYALMDNLNADVVLAYLFADDATGDDDVFEGGVRLSLSF